MGSLQANTMHSIPATGYKKGNGTALLVLPPQNPLTGEEQVHGFPTPSLILAGLPLLKRTLLSLHRGGISRFIILYQGRPDSFMLDLDQDSRFKDRLTWSSLDAANLPNNIQKEGGHCLFVGLTMHFHWSLIQDLCRIPPGDAIRLVTVEPSVSSTGLTLPIRVEGESVLELYPELRQVNAHAVPILSFPMTALDDEQPFFHTLLKRWIQEGRVKPFRAKPDHLCYPIDSPSVVKNIERELYRTVTSPLDGVVDNLLNRPVSKLLTSFFLKTPITPNGITLLSFAIGALAALLFARGGYLNGILGALLFQLSSTIDCCDGEVARLKFMESPLGKWLDITCDNVVHFMIFSGITWSVTQSATGNGLLGWGLLSLVGILLSFIMVTVSLEKEEPFQNQKNGTTTQTAHKIRWLITKMANRDFSLLILIFALLDKLPWFLILAALGSNLFWLILLGLHLRIRWETHRARMGLQR